MKIIKSAIVAVALATLSISAMADSEHHDGEVKASTPDKVVANGEMPMMGKDMPMMGKDMPMMKMMQQKHAKMDQHMTKMETHMANIEALLKQLVELQKKQ